MKRTFRPKADSTDPGYPTVRQFPADRRRMLLGLGAAVLTTALPACGGAPLADISPDGGAPDAAWAGRTDAASHRAQDGGAPDAGAPEDAELLGGGAPMPDVDAGSE